MDDLLSEFATELSEGYAALAPDLVRWRECPHDKALSDALFRYLHSAKGGAGFVRMARIEQLAAAAEQALSDVRHWGLDHTAPQIGLIITTLERIDAIATALELGISHPNLGEDALVADMTGGRNIYTQGATPYDPVQIGSVRLPIAMIDELLANTERFGQSLTRLGDVPLPSALALLRNDMTHHLSCVRRLRYVPITQLFKGMQRYIDDLTMNRDQMITFLYEPCDVQIDRATLPILRDALRHLIRNAVAHGIEPVAVRIKNGKSEQGIISILATQCEDVLRIELSDDGGGVDMAALASLAEVSAYANSDALDYAKLPGVTTAQNISALAGHGMGLDAVRIAMERIDGALELYDYPGQGFSSHLLIPLKKA